MKGSEFINLVIADYFKTLKRSRNNDRYENSLNKRRVYGRRRTMSLTAAQIKTAYESNLDTNAFTDAEKTKLANLQLCDCTPIGIKTAYESNLNTNAFTNAEKVKLASLAILTPPDIKIAYESNLDTNAFTDAEKAKLASLSNPTAGDVKVAYESNPDTNAFTDAEKAKLATVTDVGAVSKRVMVSNEGVIQESPMITYSDSIFSSFCDGGITLSTPGGEWVDRIHQRSDSGGVHRLAIDSATDYYGTTVEAVSIAGDNVGIGTTEPTYPLDVQRDGVCSFIRTKGSSDGFNYSGITFANNDNEKKWQFSYKADSQNVDQLHLEFFNGTDWIQHTKFPIQPRNLRLDGYVDQWVDFPDGSAIFDADKFVRVPTDDKGGISWVGYNSNRGDIQVPETGLYLFNIHCYTWNSSGRAVLWRNSSAIALMHYHNREDPAIHNTATLNTVLWLTPSDIVNFKSSGGFRMFCGGIHSGMTVTKIN